MEKLFVPYEIAFKLKQLGFNENCFAKYNSKKEIDYFERPQAFYCVNSKSSWFSPIFSSKETVSKVCTAPTHQQVIDWFRDKHQVFIDIQTDCTSYPKFAFEINVFTGNPKDLSEREWGWEHKKDFEWYLYRSYYEAVDNAIEQAIKLIQK
jgi:hypothetical protein